MALTGMVQSALSTNGKPVYTGITDAYTTASTRQVVPRHDRRQPHDGGEAGPLWQRCRQIRQPIRAKRGTVADDEEGVLLRRRRLREDRHRDPPPDTLHACSVQPIATHIWRWDTQMLSCSLTGGNYSAVFQTGTLDGTPLFFPVDGDTFTPASERTARPSRRPTTPTTRRARRAVAQLQLHRRGPPLVQVRRDQDVQD